MFLARRIRSVRCLVGRDIGRHLVDIPRPVLGSDARFRQYSGPKLGSRNWAKGSAHNDTH